MLPLTGSRRLPKWAGEQRHQDGQAVCHHHSPRAGGHYRQVSWNHQGHHADRARTVGVRVQGRQRQGRTTQHCHRMNTKRACKNRGEVDIGLLLIGITVVMCLAIAAALVRRDHSYNPYRYRAWMKATGNTNLTFNEWMTLKNNYLLPGQSPASTTTIIPIYTGR